MIDNIGLLFMGFVGCFGSRRIAFRSCSEVWCVGV